MKFSLDVSRFPILKVAIVKDSERDLPVYHKSSLLERVVWLTDLQKKYSKSNKYLVFSSQYSVCLVITPEETDNMV